MVDEATTWGALLNRRRDASFIGREQARADFRLNMVYEVPPTLLFFVSGPEGIGKSALLARYRTLAEEYGFLIGRVDGAQARADPEGAALSAMAAISSQFADQGTPLTTFHEQYTDYLDALGAIAEDPQAPAAPLDWFEGVSAEGEWHQRFWTPYLATRFSARLLPVLREPVQSLTSVFVSDLNAWASIRNLVLFFDDWQALAPMLEPWLIDLLQAGELHINVWLVIADVEPPGEPWQGLSQVMLVQPLPPLSERDVLAYGRIHPIRGWDHPTEAYAITRGVPLLLKLLMEADSIPSHDHSVPGEGISAVDAYLASLDGMRREAVLRSAAARRLSPQVMTTLLGDDGEAAFDWLTRSPIVVAQGDTWVYHARLRDRVRTWAQRAHPEGWMAAHGRLSAYYRNLDEDAFARGRGKIARERIRRRELLYHRLIAGGDEGRNEAQQAFLDALRADYRWAAEVVAIWQAAAETPGAPDAVIVWASRLSQGWAALRARDWTSALTFCDTILDSEALDESLQPAYRRLRNWIAGQLGLPLDEQEKVGEQDVDTDVVDVKSEPAALEPGPQRAGVATALASSAGVVSSPPSSTTDAESMKEPVEAPSTASTSEKPIPPSSEAIPESDDVLTAGKSEVSVPPEPAVDEDAAPEPPADQMAAKAEATLERANALFKEGDYLGAIQIYSRAIDQDPNKVSAYFNRGLTHLKLNDLRAALDDFNKVLSLDPGNPSAHYQRGMIHVRREDLTAAIEDFNGALSAMPESAALYAQRASAYYQLQAYQRAVDDYTQALTLRPEDVTFLLNRGLTYVALEEVEQALDDYDRAVEQAPDNALAYYYRGQAYIQQDAERQALEDFDEALRLDPENAEIHTGLGMVHARMLNFGRALDAYERAMALDPENARTYYNAACAAALSEREDQALAWLERAIALRSRYRIMARQDPDFSFVRDHPAFQRLTSE